MKKLIVLGLLALTLSGCGYSARDNEMTGQVKKVMLNTPIVCPDYADADISLGVMRNGVGSMSTEDIWVYVPDHSMYKILKDASATGALVKISYDVKRFTICVEDHRVTNVEVLK